LVGIAGAIPSPIAAELADKGNTLPATAAALLRGDLGFALPPRAPESRPVALGLLVIASIVLGRRALFALGAEVRRRLNGIYFALFFTGGAPGSAVAPGCWPPTAGGRR
jgi:hypothetical protein